MKLPLEGEMTRQHRILFGATLTGLYTLGLATTTADRVDEDRFMDDVGVPHRYEQLRPYDREYLEKFLNDAEERTQSKEKGVESNGGHGEQCQRIHDSMKSMLAIAEVMAEIKNGAQRAKMVIELDPNDPNPHITVRKLMTGFDEPVGPLPDGSGFMTGKFPLPKDHWLYAPSSEGWDETRDCNPDMPQPVMDNTPENHEAIRRALKYAIRGATMNGKDMDFDPDALILNAIQAFTGRGIGIKLEAHATDGHPLSPVDDNDHPDAAEN